MRTNIFLLLSFLLAINTTIAQKKETQTYDQLITAAALKEDLALLKYNLESIHAGLYAYQPKAVIDKAFATIASELNEPMTAMEFNRKLCRLHPLIANGHTAFEFSTAFVEATQKTLLRLPFAVYKDQEALYITANYSRDTTIEQAWKIKTINGESAVAIFDEIVNLKTRDGYNLTGPIAYTNKSFSFYYACFKGTPAQFTIVFEDENGVEKTYEIEAITLDEIKKNRAERYEAAPKSVFEQGLPGLDLKIKDHIATITIHTFEEEYIKKHGKKSKVWFQDAFEQIEAAQVEHLIIDMRDNGGGGPSVSVALMSHLLEEPFTFYKEISTITRKIPNPKYYKDNVRLFNLTAAFRAKKQDNGTFRVNLLGTKPYKTSTPTYKGKLYVLIHGVSFSQTGETAGFLKSETDAIFIGEEVGGNAYQNTSGLMLQLELPNSKNIAYLPIVLWIMNVQFENNGHGVIPDHIVQPSLQEVLDRRDVVMDYTLELIE